MSTIVPIPIYSDNYVWLITNKHKDAIAIDPGDSQPVLGFLHKHQLILKKILVTHSHWDHTSGVTPLRQVYDCPVYGPASVSAVTHALNDGDTLSLATGDNFKVLEIPGHTPEHIAFYSQNLASLFCGDTLFSAGCGRLLGGTAEQFKQSLDRIKQLPPNTLVHAAHEYTLSNLAFAETVMPLNNAVKRRKKQAVAQRDAQRPTLPVTLGDECQYNPFLRCDDPEVISSIKTKFTLSSIPDELEVFILLRQWKDNF